MAALPHLLALRLVAEPIKGAHGSAGVSERWIDLAERARLEPIRIYRREGDVVLMSAEAYAEMTRVTTPPT